MPDAIRIAMWSGPRNISTALMRSFEARDDCFVTDEPLYAHYLDVTKLDHPMAAEIIERRSSPTGLTTVAVRPSSNSFRSSA